MAKEEILKIKLINEKTNKQTTLLARRSSKIS